MSETYQIKQLEFQKRDSNSASEVYWAKTFVHDYMIYFDPALPENGYETNYGSFYTQRFASYTEAEEASQKDFEERMKQGLSPTTN